MRFQSRFLRPLVGCFILVAACAPEADVSAGELSAVIERDAVVLDGNRPPSEVLDRLADHRVVLLGETHHLREHWTFVADLLSELHERGFRQLLIESPQMASWLYDDYVRGGIVAPDWEPPPFYERRLAAIRDLNATLPSGEEIHVRGIDANEEWYGGAGGFQSLFDWLVEHLPGQDASGLALGVAYGQDDPEGQTESLEQLTSTFDSRRAELERAWGAEWVAVVDEMIEVEMDSIDIRARRIDDDDDGARSREEVIKRLSDRRIAECSCGTIINIGAHHAQKSHLMGTEQEWMGDYLTHESTVVDGSILVIGLTSARTELEPGAGGTPFDVTATSPENELLRRLAEARPGQTVFLPLDDPLFSERRVAYNSEDVIYATPLRDQFDAILQYGLAHRMPVD